MLPVDVELCTKLYSNEKLRKLYSNEKLRKLYMYKELAIGSAV